MELNQLTAISPVDGRYRKSTQVLDEYFSEFALIKYRVIVEVRYFIALSKTLDIQIEKDTIGVLNFIISKFKITDAKRIKEIEKTTNHDVKAVEYFLKEKFEELGINLNKEFIHFGLTSQDINNTAIPLSLKEGIENVLLTEIENLISQFQKLSDETIDIPMLAKTHGQPASPTNLGKEILVFIERLTKQANKLYDFNYPAKFGGATGNFNAHQFVYPDIDWIRFANRFCAEDLGLKRNQFTTQIDHYDDLAELFQIFIRIDTILIDFCRDVWQYISMEYFKQKTVETEVGSSAMPHKVNPIDFENAEGNLGIANAILDHLSLKLPISRLQRDLTDSTVLRNIGVPFAHLLISLKSIQKGVNKLVVNKAVIENDLLINYAVIAEGIQSLLRSINYPNPYEALKHFSRGKTNLTKQDFEDFINSLNVDQEVKLKLTQLSPLNYIGTFPKE